MDFRRGCIGGYGFGFVVVLEGFWGFFGRILEGLIWVAFYWGYVEFIYGYWDLFCLCFEMII